MARGLLVGLTEDELVTMRKAAIAALLPGGSRSGFQLGELSVQIDTGSMKPAELLEEVNYALRKLNPSVYGANVTRVIAGYNTVGGGSYGS